MAERFPRASLLQGMVTPVSGGVRVPTGADPALQMQANMQGSLATRLDQFAATANKMAVAKAETQGLAFGAANAPTAQEVYQAAQTGQPLNLPGDASSFNVFQQAAYKGSLAVTEDRMDIAGRRYLTNVFAEAAADPAMDPSTLTAKLDSAVSEFASSLSAVSPQSGAKVGKSLGIVANSQVVQFTREYMARQTKLAKSNAVASGTLLIQQASDIVSGYAPQENGANLKAHIEAGRRRLTSALQNGGVDPREILKFQADYNDKIAEAQVNAIRNWAQTSPAYADNPLLAFQELRAFVSGKKSHNVPPRLQEMWKMMDEQSRAKSFDGVMDLIKTYNQAEELADNRADAAELKTFKQIQSTVPQLIEQNNREELQKVVKQYNNLGRYDEAADLQEFLDRNETILTSDLKDITRLKQLRSLGILKFGDIAKARLNETDRADFLQSTIAQRDENIQRALRDAKIALRVTDEDLINKLDQLTKYKQIQRLYYEQIDAQVTRARDKFIKVQREKIKNNEPRTSEDFFDVESLVSKLLADVKTTENARQIDIQRKVIEREFNDLTRNTPEAQRPEMSREFFRSFVAEGSTAQKSQKDAAKRALQAYLVISQIEAR